MSTFKEKSDIVAVWVTVIGALSAGCFSIFQFLSSENSDRIKQSLSYVEMYNKDPYLKIRNEINSFWEARSEEVFKQEKIGESELSKYLLSQTTNSKIGRKFSFLVDFYDNLQVCSCNKICDPETVREFFGKEAYDFYGTFYPYIKNERERQKDKSFAESLIVLGRSHKSKDDFEKMYCKG